MVNTTTLDHNKAQRRWAAEGINVLDIKNAIKRKGKRCGVMVVFQALRY